MKVSEYGIVMIKKFEGFRDTAYKAVPSERFWTIGYGHYGADVKAGQKISMDDAEALLRSDLRSYESRVQKYTSYAWTQNEFDALVSFCYNIGNIDQLTANGTRSRAEIAAAMLKYTKAGGKELPGLVKRRKEEHDLFLKTGALAADEYELALRVYRGEFGAGAERRALLGSNYDRVQKVVNVVDLVMKGQFGNGKNRMMSLAANGYDAERVQWIVNNLLK